MDANEALFLGKAYFGDDNFENAIPYLKIAAECGKVAAQTMLGFCFMDGLGVHVNQREATRLFELAAVRGDAIAQLRLADAYHHGRGVEENMDQAMRWYRESADNGLPEAQFMYARLCPYFARYEDAEKYAKMAFDNGCESAFQLLSEIHEIKEEEDFRDKFGLKLALNEILKLMDKE